MLEFFETLSFSDDEEAELIEAIENMKLPIKSFLTPERRAEVEAMARSTLIALRETADLGPDNIAEPR